MAAAIVSDAPVMPAIIQRLSVNGLQSVDYEAESLNAAAKFEPRAGVYTVSNTYHGTQTLLLGAHLDRLEDSARRQNIPLVCDRPLIRSALRQMILASGFGDVRFRISVDAAAPDEYLLTIEPFKPPASDILADGVRCVTSRTASRSDPAAKTNDWMHERAKLLASMPAAAYEVFLVDEMGQLLEGMTSNFYAVIDGSLYTASRGMLAGISRQVVLEVCAGFLPVQLSAPRYEDIAAFSEAFMSSSSRGLIPVVEIDRLPIGQGCPGATTKSLQARYRSWAEAHLEEL